MQVPSWNIKCFLSWESNFKKIFLKCVFWVSNFLNCIFGICGRFFFVFSSLDIIRVAQVVTYITTWMTYGKIILCLKGPINKNALNNFKPLSCLSLDSGKDAWLPGEWRYSTRWAERISLRELGYQTLVAKW